MNARNKVTIEDISRETGLSRGTISRALNNRPDISAETKARVLAACEKLKYVPSTAARALATGKFYAVVVFVLDLTEAFAAEFLRGVLIQAEMARYSVNVVELGPADVRADRIRSLNLERLDGALICSPISEQEISLLGEKLDGRVAVAAFPCNKTDCDSIIPDQVESGRLVARHLLRANPNDIAYLHEPTAEHAAERLNGFSEVCREAGIDTGKVIAHTENGTAQSAISRIIDERGSSITGIGATNDELAYTALIALAAHNRRAGVDVTVVGQGNSPASRSIIPTLTTTDFRAVEIGRRAMEALVSRLNMTRSDQAQQTTIEPRLEIRSSSTL